jgi:hypothetical protein
MEDIEVVAVERLEEVLEQALTERPALDRTPGSPFQAEILAAKGLGSSLGGGKSRGIALEQN